MNGKQSNFTHIINRKPDTRRPNLKKKSEDISFKMKNKEKNAWHALLKPKYNVRRI